jgi:transcriptional regulator with XRE-family HTH domain
MDWRQAFDTDWGARILEKRKKRGLTLAQVYRRTGLPGPVIRRAELEPSKVPLNKLVALLEFYGLTIEEHLELCTIRVAR